MMATNAAALMRRVGMLIASRGRLPVVGSGLMHCAAHSNPAYSKQAHARGFMTSLEEEPDRDLFPYLYEFTDPLTSVADTDTSGSCERLKHRVQDEDAHDASKAQGTAEGFVRGVAGSDRVARGDASADRSAFLATTTLCTRVFVAPGASSPRVIPVLIPRHCSHTELVARTMRAVKLETANDPAPAARNGLPLSQTAAGDVLLRVRHPTNASLYWEVDESSAALLQENDVVEVHVK